MLITDGTCSILLLSWTTKFTRTTSVTIINIRAVVRLGFQLGQFNIGKYNDVQVRGSITCHCSFFVPV
jgi:hypothetical protein